MILAVKTLERKNTPMIYYGFNLLMYIYCQLKESSTGILKDKDGRRVEYDRSTGKLEAIK